MLACAPRPDPAADRILLVTIDTLRADHVGCYGAGAARTPRLDALAAAGVRFETAVAPTPLTLPSHASLLTALDPPSHGVRHNGVHRLPDGIPTLAEAMRGAGYATAATVGAVVLHRRFGLDRGFDHYDDDVGARRSGTVGYAERRADRVVDAALDWLEGAPDRFFLWVHFYDPHRSYEPPPGFASAFASDPYAGEIAFADSQLGRLLDAIEERWGESGLLVAVTSDHGESRGEHGEFTHSYTLYEATQRVPLVMRGPGLPAGTRVAGVSRLGDVAPTLLALSGLPPLPGAEGRDLRPLIAGREREPRRAYLETLATQLDFHWSPLLGIRTDRFKYIRAPRPELYDLEADPAETRNLAPREPERIGRLDRVLAARLASAREPTRLALPAGERARLRALGYLAPPDAGNADLGRVSGPDPKDEIGVLRVLGEAEQLLGEGAAGEAYERLAALDGGGPTLDALRAAAAVTAGRYAEAERAARRALAEEPGRSDVLIVLGRALAARGLRDPARAAFEAALASDPTAREARRRLDELAR